MLKISYPKVGSSTLPAATIVSPLAGVYWEWSKRKVSPLFCAALRVRFCISHARRNEVIVASERTSAKLCHILGDGNGRRSGGTRLGKGNTKSVATKIVELLITEQVSRTAEPLTRALSVNYR
jgi:hypothetical protein